MQTMKEFQLSPGDRIDLAVPVMMAKANEENASYFMLFNGTRLEAHPGDSMDAVMYPWMMRMREDSKQPQDKKVIVMRGISGSGKSTLARKLALEAHERWELPIICSADDYFIGEDGVYRFDVELLDRAHRACIRKFLLALEDGMSPIFVDNTNINLEDISTYVNVGQALGYEVEILQVDTPLEVARGRNVHGASDKIVEAMHKRMQHVKLPNRFKVTHINPEE
jgi:predicted kinase